MREINEEEANRLAGEETPPVIIKVENDATQSAVCLKRLKTGFLLGISSETKGRLRMFLFEDERLAHTAFQKHAIQMDNTGFPFLDK